MKYIFYLYFIFQISPVRHRTCIPLCLHYLFFYHTVALFSFLCSSVCSDGCKTMFWQNILVSNFPPISPGPPLSTLCYHFVRCGTIPRCLPHIRAHPSVHMCEWHLGGKMSMPWYLNFDPCYMWDRILRSLLINMNAEMQKALQDSSSGLMIQSGYHKPLLVVSSNLNDSLFIWSNCSLSIAHRESNDNLATAIRQLKQAHANVPTSNTNNVNKGRQRPSRIRPKKKPTQTSEKRKTWAQKVEISLRNTSPVRFRETKVLAVCLVSSWNQHIQASQGQQTFVQSNHQELQDCSMLAKARSSFHTDSQILP